MAKYENGKQLYPMFWFAQYLEKRPQSFRGNTEYYMAYAAEMLRAPVFCMQENRKESRLP